MKRRNKVMIIIGILMVCIGGIIIYWNIPYSPYKAAFIHEMEERVEGIISTKEVCTAKEIEQLPEPLQRYCQYIGLVNQPKYQAARIIFHNTRFVFNDESGKIINMNYDLWLFFNRPFRSAYCTSSMFGIPFDGIDYCTENKEGGVKGILGKTIKIFDEHYSEGYRAVLISWVAEAVALNPSVLLSPYVTYEVIDENKVKATVTYNGVSGTGIFTINEEGAITEFYSDERQIEKIDGVKTAIGWRCEYENYSMENGIRRIGTVRAIKVYPNKEVTYFDSDNFSIEYLK